MGCDGMIRDVWSSVTDWLLVIDTTRVLDMEESFHADKRLSYERAYWAFCCQLCEDSL